MGSSSGAISALTVGHGAAAQLEPVSSSGWGGSSVELCPSTVNAYVSSMVPLAPVVLHIA